MDQYRLLHVEDDPMDVRLFGMMLDELRVPPSRVCRAVRVEAALEILRQERIDLVFLDLPDSGGLDALERVLAAGFDVPVVVLTGIEEEELGGETLHGTAASRSGSYAGPSIPERRMVHPPGFEPGTDRLEGGCSIH